MVAPYALAGLFSEWRPRQGSPHPPLDTFSIVTKEANELMEPIHNRMPVILQPFRANAASIADAISSLIANALRYSSTGNSSLFGIHPFRESRSICGALSAPARSLAISELP